MQEYTPTPDFYNDYLAHHGILGMRWGHRNGPPYPLNSSVSTGKSLKKEAKEYDRRDKRNAKNEKRFLKSSPEKQKKILDKAIKTIHKENSKHDEKVIRDIQKKVKRGRLTIPEQNEMIDDLSKTHKAYELASKYQNEYNTAYKKWENIWKQYDDMTRKYPTAESIDKAQDPFKIVNKIVDLGSKEDMAYATMNDIRRRAAKELYSDFNTGFSSSMNYTVDKTSWIAEQAMTKRFEESRKQKRT